MIENEATLLSELMLQTEIMCSRLEAGADDMLDTSQQDELRLKISQCRAILSQLQNLYQEDKLTTDHPLTAATFRQLIMSLLWVIFRARELVDYKLFRKLVAIESGFTYLLINRRESKL